MCPPFTSQNYWPQGTGEHRLCLILSPYSFPPQSGPRIGLSASEANTCGQVGHRGMSGLQGDDQDWDAAGRPLARTTDIWPLRSTSFKVAQDGDLKLVRRVRRLQMLMLRSWSDTLASVRGITQRDAWQRYGDHQRDLPIDVPQIHPRDSSPGDSRRDREQLEPGDQRGNEDGQVGDHFTHEDLPEMSCGGRSPKLHRLIGWWLGQRPQLDP